MCSEKVRVCQLRVMEVGESAGRGRQCGMREGENDDGGVGPITVLARLSHVPYLRDERAATRLLQTRLSLLLRRGAPLHSEVTEESSLLVRV